MLIRFNVFLYSPLESPRNEILNSKGKKTPKDKELLFYYLNNRMTKYQTVSKLPATLCFEL